MDTFGVALIAGGMAVLCSRLVFLVPVEHKLSASQESFEVNREQIEFYLEQMRREARH